MLDFSYAVYDENKNIYDISTRMRIDKNEKYDYNWIFMEKELGVYGGNELLEYNLHPNYKNKNVAIIGVGNAVSYTHLDVYKRQVKSFSILKIVFLSNPVNSDNFSCVIFALFLYSCNINSPS